MIVTRFAPSPTGFLHIGGARTALFSYLWARHNGGEFKLRIEDTDAARNNDAATSAILDGLKWLGIEWDGEVVYQSHNADRHREVVAQLIANGSAYFCDLSDEEANAIRDANRASGKPFRSPNRDQNCNSGVVRFKSPDSGETTIVDKVQGRVTVKHETFSDFVILRREPGADLMLPGTPVFLLASAVDDHDMGVNTIIRGDDHLNNAFLQLAIYDAMGWEHPTYAHVPLIFNQEGKPLSKRDGVAGVEDYQTDYLPEALFNYLLRLGWGHGNDEIISKEQAREWFDIAKVGRNPAKIDPAKLLSLNAHYIQTANICRAIGMAGFESRGDLGRICPEVQKRSKTLSDMRSMVKFIDERPWTYWAIDPRAWEIADYLAEIKGRHYVGEGEAMRYHYGDWNHDAIDAALRRYAADKGLKFGEVSGIVRVALTGMKQHIGVHDLLLSLDRDESLARLRALAAPRFGLSEAKWETGPVGPQL